MIKLGRFCAVAVLACGLAAGLTASQPAAAASLEDAQSLFAAGNFRAAALAGASVETPESLALASRARLVRAAYLLPPEQAVEELDRAEALARHSLKMQPEQVDAALDLAIIIGYRTRLDGYVNSYFAGRAEEAKHLITGAQALDPSSGWAQLVFGAWNAEIVVGAGAGLADTLYGATRDKAVAAFEEAVTLDGANPTIRLEYAKALIKLYGEAGWPTAEGHLKIALAASPAGQLDMLVQARAQKLLTALQGGDAQAVAASLKEVDPFSR